MNILQILQAYYQNKTYSFTGSVSEEIKKMNQQSLAGYLYFVYGQPFEQVYLGCTLMQEKFHHLEEKISSLFVSHQIKHLFIKGAVLSKLYPDEALRLRGDIDVVVCPEEYSFAQKLLKEQGFQFIEECGHHTEYLYEQLVVELHLSLFEEQDIFYTYFENVFEHATQQNSYLYEMDHTFHYLYCLAHLNKHLATGEGIRYILDFFHMCQKWELDAELEEEVKKLNLEQLHHSVHGAIHIITQQSFIKHYDLRGGKKLIDAMMKKGVHAKNEDVSKATVSYQFFLFSNQSKFKFLLETLFLFNKEHRKRIYPRLSKCWLFYPILFLHRFFYLTIFKLPNLLKILFSNKKKVEKERKEQEQIGIKQLKK